MKNTMSMMACSNGWLPKISEVTASQSTHLLGKRLACSVDVVFHPRQLGEKNNLSKKIVIFFAELARVKKPVCTA